MVSDTTTPESKCASWLHDLAFGCPMLRHLCPCGRRFTPKANGPARCKPVKRLHRPKMRPCDQIGAHGCLALPQGQSMMHTADLAGLGADQPRGGIGLPHRPDSVPPKGWGIEGRFQLQSSDRDIWQDGFREMRVDGE